MCRDICCTAEGHVSEWSLGDSTKSAPCCQGLLEVIEPSPQGLSTCGPTHPVCRQYPTATAATHAASAHPSTALATTAVGASCSTTGLAVATRRPSSTCTTGCAVQQGWCQSLLAGRPAVLRRAERVLRVRSVAVRRLATHVPRHLLYG